MSMDSVCFTTLNKTSGALNPLVPARLALSVGLDVDEEMNSSMEIHAVHIHQLCLPGILVVNTRLLVLFQNNIARWFLCCMQRWGWSILRQSKVHQNPPTGLWIKQKVGRLDVSMNDAHQMNVLHSTAQLLHIDQNHGYIHGTEVMTEILMMEVRQHSQDLVLESNCRQQWHHIFMTHVLEHLQFGKNSSWRRCHIDAFQCNISCLLILFCTCWSRRVAMDHCSVHWRECAFTNLPNDLIPLLQTRTTVIQIADFLLQRRRQRIHLSEFKCLVCVPWSFTCVRTGVGFQLIWIHKKEKKSEWIQWHKHNRLILWLQRRRLHQRNLLLIIECINCKGQFLRFPMVQ